MLGEHQKIDLNDEHVLVVVGEQRAWVVDEDGKRVSINWTREPGEDLHAFVRRTTDQAHRVIAFISPAN